MKLVIVTGLSGSGKTIALHTLEDIKYYCIDNLPVGMLGSLVEQAQGDWGEDHPKIAVGIDARSSAKELQKIDHYLKPLSDKQIQTQIIFLYANEATLIKRFSETRRKHPLSNEQLSLKEALNLEKHMLEPLASRADILIDTSSTTIHQLRDIVRERLNIDKKEMAIQFQSFGFKYGIPVDVDMVLDVRCLPNPHWDTRLRSLTGRDQAVIDYLEQHDEVRQMKEQLTHYFETWLPQFARSNRSYMTIAIGCTGGQHRSVYLVEHLAAHFKKQYANVIVRHRELA